MFKKIDLKLWATIALSGVVVVTGAALVSQWKYASIGRQVSRNVLRFLIDNGAKVENGTIHGGVVPVPMKIGTAVNSAVSQMLNAVSKQMSGRSSHNKYGRSASDGDDTDEDEEDIAESQQQRHSKPLEEGRGDEIADEDIVARQQQQQQQQHPRPKSSPQSRNRKGGDVAEASESSPPSRLPDDGGYALSAKKSTRSDFTYNPNEFMPAAKPSGTVPSRSAIFSDEDEADRRQSKWHRQKKQSRGSPKPTTDQDDQDGDI